jgi:hypothetical protein
LLATVVHATTACAAETSRLALPLSPSPSKYILTLNLNEFSILNVSLMDGLLKYGGTAELDFRLARERDSVYWTVTLTNTALFDAASIYVAQRTVKLIQTLDPQTLDTNSRVALLAVKSLTEKMDWARQNPLWDPATVAGTVRAERSHLVLTGSYGSLRITGTQAETLKALCGRQVVASGFLKVKDQLEVISFREKKTNTLELFVMSFCPFAQQAELKVLDALEKISEPGRPRLDVRYIFYQRESGGTNHFTALHGEPEVKENLTQLLLRERYPQLLPLYLRLRSGCGDQPFARVAAQVGLSPSEIQEIEQFIVRERDALIQAEYAYVAGTHGIQDGSPTYVWESEQVTDLRQVEALKSVTLAASGECSQ